MLTARIQSRNGQDVMNNIRWKEIGIALFTIASAVVTNLNLLGLSPESEKIITFACLIILAFNHSVLTARQEQNVIDVKK